VVSSLHVFQLKLFDLFYVFLLSPKLAIYPSHLSLLDSITQIIVYVEEYIMADICLYIDSIERRGRRLSSGGGRQLIV
jgi:hypothetical protein